LCDHLHPARENLEVEGTALEEAGEGVGVAREVGAQAARLIEINIEILLRWSTRGHRSPRATGYYRTVVSIPAHMMNAKYMLRCS